MVGAEAVHRQGTDQDRHAGQLQRTTVVPATTGRVHGVLAPAGQSISFSGRRSTDAGKMPFVGLCFISAAPKVSAYDL